MPDRIRLAYVDPDDIVRAFLYSGTGFPAATAPGAVNTLKRLRLDGVPEGAAVVRAFYCPVRARIGLVVRHADFDAVPDGEVPPAVAVEVESFLTDEAGRLVGRASTWRDCPPLF